MKAKITRIFSKEGEYDFNCACSNMIVHRRFPYKNHKKNRNRSKNVRLMTN